jgi:hypothetical protein
MVLVHPDPEGMLAIFGLIVLPSVTIAARLLIRPVTDALLRLRGASQPPPPPVENARIAVLEEEVQQLREELERVRTFAQFDAQLRAPAPAEPQRLSGAAS